MSARVCCAGRDHADGRRRCVRSAHRRVATASSKPSRPERQPHDGDSSTTRIGRVDRAAQPVSQLSESCRSVPDRISVIPQVSARPGLLIDERDGLPAPGEHPRGDHAGWPGADQATFMSSLAAPIAAPVLRLDPRPVATGVMPAIVPGSPSITVKQSLQRPTKQNPPRGEPSCESIRENAVPGSATRFATVSVSTAVQSLAIERDLDRARRPRGPSPGLCHSSSTFPLHATNWVVISSSGRRASTCFGMAQVYSCSFTSIRRSLVGLTAHASRRALLHRDHSRVVQSIPGRRSHRTRIPEQGGRITFGFTFVLDRIGRAQRPARLRARRRASSSTTLDGKACLDGISGLWVVNCRPRPRRRSATRWPSRPVGSPTSRRCRTPRSRRCSSPRCSPSSPRRPRPRLLLLRRLGGGRDGAEDRQAGPGDARLPAALQGHRPARLLPRHDLSAR